jgi:hypothetical protein
MECANGEVQKNRILVRLLVRFHGHRAGLSIDSMVDFAIVFIAASIRQTGENGTFDLQMHQKERHP